VGKDIVFLEETPLHRPIWRAIQVKRKLSGNTSADNYSLQAVIQCEAALRNPYQTSQGEVAIQEAWLITPYTLSETAKRPMEATLNDKISRMLVIEGPQLADLIQEYLPQMLEERADTGESYALTLVAFL
jgi:hypothetical protein